MTTYLLEHQNIFLNGGHMKLWQRYEGTGTHKHIWWEGKMVQPPWERLSIFGKS